MLEKTLFHRVLVFALLVAPACASEVGLDIDVETSELVLGSVDANANYPRVVQLSGNLPRRADRTALGADRGALRQSRGGWRDRLVFAPRSRTGKATRGSQFAGPSNLFVHPEWSARTLSHDPALIKLPATLDPLVVSPHSHGTEVTSSPIASSRWIRMMSVAIEYT